MDSPPISDHLESIAIIGMALKFPGEATSPDTFWNTLLGGRCLSTKIPLERMAASSFYHQDKTRTDTLNNISGHFITEDITAFDAPFFSISATEAAGLDPQQRLLLEASYRALESAGIPIERISHSKTSVYSASFTDDYKSINAKDPETGSSYGANGLSPNMLANRISWFYNLHGASFNVDSACSSSLMALDVACQGLRNGDANMSLVAGSNLILNIDWMLLLSKMSFLSPDGKCFSFDQRGNGYGRGEGVSVIVLKRVSDAIRDGDNIRAVIRSCGSNSDGRTGQITQPSPEAQESLIRETYAKAKLDMSVTRFMEAHGTGTAAGDPIEAQAIGACFRNFRSAEEPLYIGAVKSIIGHLEGCSGLGGIIKTVLILENGLITPNANFEKLNTKIDHKFQNLEFPVEATPWPDDGLRRASVNSFGFGGSNSHVILDDAFHYLQARALRGNHQTVARPPNLGTPKPPSIPDEGYSSQSSEGESIHSDNNRPLLLTWSANDEKALINVTEQYENHTYKRLSNQFRNLAYTLNSRRTKFKCRTWALINSVSEMSGLRAHLSPIQTCVSEPRIGFVFTGQGAQWFAMGRELLSFPVFKDSLLLFSEHLQDIGCQWSLLDELSRDKSTSLISRPEFSQPICTAIQVAVVVLLKHFGITPAVVLGHSSGEIAAAYTTGAISAKAACRISYFRGLLSSQLAASSREDPGNMMAVGISEEQVRPYFQRVFKEMNRQSLTVACMNSPKSTTISGKKADIEFLKQLLDEDAIFARVLDVPVAYHSPMMNDIADEYLSLLGDLRSDKTQTKPDVEMISSLTGSRVPPGELSCGKYWVANMVSPVNFAKALTKLRFNTGKIRKKLNGTHKDLAYINDLLEIGPHSALQGPIRDTLMAQGKSSSIRYFSVLVRNQSAMKSALTAMGNLQSLGYPIDLLRVNQMDHCVDLKPLVDLPEYPFDHSKSYWCESRLSQGLRLRKVAKNDLLGTPVADWNPNEARWKNFVKVSELPWVVDHKVGGSTLYPAAGMLCMAIEAANQLADHARVVKGFSIKDATFIAPMTIPTTPEGLETQCFLHPLQQITATSTTWYEFRLSTFVGYWTEVCRGNIQVEYELSAEASSSWQDVAFAIRTSHLEEFEDIKNLCPNTVIPKNMFKVLHTAGYDYGKAFQRFEDILAGVYLATAEINIYQDYLEPHVIHPTTLDGIFQLALVALTNGCQDKLDLGLPTRVNSMWISKLGLSNEAKTIKATARAQLDGRITESTLRVLDGDLQNLLLRIDGLEMTNIPQTLPEEAEPAPKLCCGVAWKPDLDLLSQSELLQFCQEIPKDDEPIDFFHDLNILLHASMQKSLSSPPSEVDPTRPYIQRYQQWMARAANLFQETATPAKIFVWNELVKDDVLFKQACARLRNVNRQGPLYVAVVEALDDIINGKVDILSLLFKGTLATEFYEDMNERANCMRQFAKYLDTAVHKDPGMKILEIGAGTGGTTEMIMRTLVSGDGERRYKTYDFTDISASFFEKAREKFERCTNMNFKTFNIEVDPVSQGFEDESYDLIIAANVLHATKDISVTIRNTRNLLKPGGKLMLYEVTSPETIYANFVFGLLPGWWLGVEEFRQWSPFMTTERWDSVLSDQGFSGADLILSDYENDECRSCSVIVSTATGGKDRSTIPELVLVLSDTPSENEEAIAAELKTVLQSNGCPGCTREIISDLPQGNSQTGLHHIFLVDLESSHGSNLSSNHLKAIQWACGASRGILWVSENKTPDHAIIDGLSKTVRNEFPGLNFSTLALERPCINKPLTATKILDVLRATFLQDSDVGELTYNEKKGRLEIPRLVQANRINSEINERSLARNKSTKRLDTCPPLKLVAGASGQLDSMCLIEDSGFDGPLQEGEVFIEVKAIGVDSKDRQIALGKARGILCGSEISGIVTQVGINCGFQIGDRICGNVEHGFKTFVRSKTTTLFLTPEGMSFTEAASWPSAFGTAYHSLVYIARIERDETVLIHSGASSVGQASIQIALAYGAVVFAIVATEDERYLLQEQYGLPGEHIFFDEYTSFVTGIQQATRGEGIDIIINSPSGEKLVSSLECIKSHGRFVDTGNQNIQSHKQLSVPPSAKNFTFSAVDYTSLIKERPILIRKALSGVLNLFKNGTIRLEKDLSIYRFSEIKRAFGRVLERLDSSKTVIQVETSDDVEVECDTKPTFRFMEDRTYVIAGGLGGVGRSMARWFVSNGARNLILLSRSGAASSEAKILVAELKKKGVNVETPPCDISDSSALELVLKGNGLSLPPIAGCIQSSMVLRDALFENMTHEDWSSAIKPKVQGSWNLHSLLPKDLDFFVVLSSLAGVVGSAGQANYAAGNNYEDALARFRVINGLKAVSIDLGAMLTSGALSENQNLMDKWVGETPFIPISDANLFALLDYYCNPELPILSDSTCQVAVGLETPANLHHRGIDHPPWMARSLFKHLHNIPGSFSTSGHSQSRKNENTIDITGTFKSAATLWEAGAIVTQALAEKLRNNFSGGEIDIEKPIVQYGVDSLLVVELRSWIMGRFGADVQGFEILGGASCIEVGLVVARKSKIGKETWVT